MRSRSKFHFRPFALPWQLAPPGNFRRCRSFGLWSHSRWEPKVDICICVSLSRYILIYLSENSMTYGVVRERFKIKIQHSLIFLNRKILFFVTFDRIFCYIRYQITNIFHILLKEKWMLKKNFISEHYLWGLL